MVILLKFNKFVFLLLSIFSGVLYIIKEVCKYVCKYFLLWSSIKNVIYFWLFKYMWS